MIARTVVAAICLVAIGLACVYLEFCQLRIGHRIHRRLEELDAARERLRVLELEYSLRVSPDVLEDAVQRFVDSDQELRPGV